MPLVVIGINHRTAPVDIREKVVFAGEELPEALQGLTSVPGVREALIVSTCNRTELYCVAEPEGAGATLDPNRADPDSAGTAVSTEVSNWLAHWHDLTTHRLDVTNSLYRLQGPAAVQHLFAVACGLDSLVIGEPQILGQLKDAYRAALDQKVTGPYLNRAMQTAFSVAKRVRTQTRIGANAVSVASAAVSLARTVFEKFA
jgi:glutamyl-tRNA reductase